MRITSTTASDVSRWEGHRKRTQRTMNPATRQLACLGELSDHNQRRL